MKVQEFLYQVRKLAGDEDGNRLSVSLLLTYLTEEMGAVASLFPRQESFEESYTGGVVTDSQQSWIDPQFVYVNDKLAEKTFATEMLRIASDGSQYPNRSYWALVKGIINATPDSGEIRVIGNYKPDEYTDAHLPLEMGETVSLTTIPALTGRRLSAVRYRMLSKCAEELQAFDRAQYYLQMGERTERDLRNTLNFESTVDQSFVLGTDF
jgi:hypothetical protein